MPHSRLTMDEGGVAAVEYIALLSMLVLLAITSVSMIAKMLPGAWYGPPEIVVDGPQKVPEGEPTMAAPPLTSKPILTSGEPIETAAAAAAKQGSSCANAAARSQCAARNPHGDASSAIRDQTH